jgi:hypothetical protein
MVANCQNTALPIYHYSLGVQLMAFDIAIRVGEVKKDKSTKKNQQ